jgi:hypothetical protein
MRNTISNPTKSITVSSTQEEVKNALKALTKALTIQGKTGYKVENFDEFLGELQLTKTEFLSIGVKIIINTHYVNDSTTKVEMEVQRIVGAFDETHEVTRANDHINNISSALSLALREKIEITPEDEQQSQQEEMNNSKMGNNIILSIIIIISLSFLIYTFLK